MANNEMNVLKVGNSEFEIADAQARQDCSNLKDDFHEYHSELGAGYADQIVSSIENEDQTPYNFRKVPYDSTLEKVEGIVGADVVLNQQFKLQPKAPSNGVEIVLTDNGMRIVGTSTDTVWLQMNYSDLPIVEHVYFLDKGSDSNLFSINNDIKGINTTLANRCTVGKPTDSTKKLYINMLTGVTIDEVIKPMFIDLTRTFGSQIADYAYSLEQSTAGSGVAWLKANFPKIFDSGYIAYNAGTMVHVSGLSAKKTVGFNQWDEEWEVGDIDSSTGQNVTAYGLIRSINYIPVLPNTSYYFALINGGSTNIRARFYDANKNYIGYSPSSGTVVVSNAAFVTPNNCAYMRFATPSGYGSVYNHDICINLSDPAKNGTYEPYTEHTYPLDSTIDLHGILKLDSNNNLYADGDVYGADGSISRRYGVVDLGTLDWGKGNTQSGHWRFTSTLSTAKLSASSASVPNLICTKYNSVSPNDAWVGTTGVTINNSSPLMMVCDEAYADAAAFKTAMSGVMLVYELATPTTETAEPYTATQICDPNGTEEFISDTVAPVGHTTKYLENLRKKIEGLPWNFATLIAPTEATFKATRNYTTGSLFIVNNVLYKATANIANGATITPNSNCTATTLAEVISALS